MTDLILAVVKVFRNLSGATLTLNPNRRFLGSGEAVSPLTINFFSWVGEALEAGRGIDDLAQHSSRAAAFHRKIIHDEFWGNPRFLARSTSGYRKNIKTFLFGMG